MEKILIIGCSGSGKSTLARQLGEKMNIPLIHLDQLWWRPGWTHITREEFVAAVAQEMKKPRWILDGDFNSTLEQRLPGCDTVLYLDFNRFVCLYGVVKRVLTSRGTVRPDMCEGCPERFDWDFLKWIWKWRRNNRAGHLRLLSQMRHGQVHIFRNRRQLRKFLKQI